jgi:anthranilate synthase/aminodeoxychorismate synthase-like glutamine amidotransferase
VPDARATRAGPGCGRGAGPQIVLIDNYDSFTYNLAHLLLCAGARVEVVRNDEVTAADVARFRPGGVVISPGPCTPAEAGISIEAVRACAAAIPVLGICLGHQPSPPPRPGRVRPALQQPPAAPGTATGTPAA